MLCDLHTHSVFSDGSDTPAALIRRAKACGLRAVALTDHDTTSGLPSFLTEAETAGITAVAGVELSTDHVGQELHLLGLFLPPESFEAINAFCRPYREQKERSNLELIRRLCEAGYPLGYDAIKRGTPDGNVNRANIASALMEKGFVPSVNAAFETLLDEKHGFYTPTKHPPLTDTIRFLCTLHALPVLAHPLQELDADRLCALLPAAVDAGLVGMETQHSSYDSDKQQTAARIADTFGLQHSGGSDYHGERKPTVKLGCGRDNVRVPYSVCESLYELRRTLYL